LLELSSACSHVYVLRKVLLNSYNLLDAPLLVLLVVDADIDLSELVPVWKKWSNPFEYRWIHKDGSQSL